MDLTAIEAITHNQEQTEEIISNQGGEKRRKRSKSTKRIGFKNFFKKRQSSSTSITRGVSDISHISNFTKEELEECRQVFQYFDQDNSGSITRVELSEAMDRLGFWNSPTEIAKLVDEIDLDADGSIDFSEFCQVMKKILKLKEDDEEVIRSCFDVFDIDKNGCVTKAEFVSVFEHLQSDIPRDTVEEIFTETDLDGSGKVDYQEFSQLVQRYLLDDRQ